jgi:hypothetical protein
MQMGRQSLKGRSIIGLAEDDAQAIRDKLTKLYILGTRSLNPPEDITKLI